MYANGRESQLFLHCKKSDEEYTENMIDDREYEEKDTAEGLDGEALNMLQNEGVDPDEVDQLVELAHELGISHEDAKSINDEIL